MKPPSEDDAAQEQSPPEELRDRLMGLGERSMRKSYYPELRRRMDELALAWGYLSSIIDAMPSMIVGVNGNLEITLVNAHFARMTGIEPDDAMGKPLPDLLPWLPALPEALLAVIRDGKARTLRKIPGAGAADPGWYDAVVFRPGQASPEAVARIDDVTSRVRMEEMLMQTEKMISVGALAAGMAHEINNPLAGILQGVQSVQRRVTADIEANRRAARKAGIDLEALKAYLLDRDVPGLLESIRESGVRASRIVTNILEFSRRSDMSKALVRLSGLVEKALELAVNEFDLKKKYDFRHIAISRQDDPSQPSVWCVPTQIEQVVLNLLKNAAQALSSSGTPTPAITVRTGVSEGMAFIEVGDNGPGMDETTRERVFEPFFTTKKPGEGTGLGLSVVYFIVVEQHEGRVAVESAKGEGTRITIKLPLNSA
ncbi:MAG: two-component system sensor histidine kinase NtrB [Thermodesulfobacteriota bacterium]